MTFRETLFTDQELVLCQHHLKQKTLGAATLPLAVILTVLKTLTLAAVLYVEYEVIYRVFEYLTGDNDYWSPGIMAFTAASMVLGFHLLAHKRPNNAAARFIERTAQFLIPLYLVGIGLFIASILDVGSLIDVDTDIAIGGAVGAEQDHWLSSLLTSLTNPLAATLFSVGLGGVAVINIFVAHELMGSIVASAQDIMARYHSAKQAIQDYRIIRQSQKRYSQLRSDLDAMTAADLPSIQSTVATTAIAQRDEALRPHQEWLVDQQLGSRSPFELDEDADPAAVAKLLTPLEAISRADILSALQSHTHLEAHA